MSDTRYHISGPEFLAAGDTEGILRSLPEWFGVESSLLQYTRDAENLPNFLATCDHLPVGFLSIRSPSATAREVHVMAVQRDHRRRGLGRRLLMAAEEWMRRNHVAELQVKTLSEQSPDPYYAETRRFYAAQGFVPSAERPELWGSEHPCLVMTKPLV